jgi:hypothetical protein
VELKGSLGDFSLPDIVQLIGSTKRTGVLVVKVGPDKASIYFDEGTIVHSEFRDLSGQESVNRIFKEQEGSFQFLAGEEAPSKDIALDWMNVLMEAARLQDEGSKDDDFDGLDFEAAMTGPAEEVGVEGREKAPAWDPEPVKQKMAEILEGAFGKKAKKILKVLKKDSGSKLSLLEFCEKAEKYVYVFIDNKQAEEIGRKLRAAIEESIL